MVLLGLDYARRIHEADPDSLTGWKLIGQIEAAREPVVEPANRVQRYRLPFDPVFDLTAVRATYALRRAHQAAPNDFLTLLLLSQQYEDRGMNEAAVPLYEHLIGLRPINQSQSEMQVKAATKLAQLRELSGRDPTDLGKPERARPDRASTARHGRAGSAADVLERAYPSETRPWEVTDRIATLRLHLGEAERARALWEKAMPRLAPRSARPASRCSYFVEGSFDDARRLYQEALREDRTSSRPTTAWPSWKKTRACANRGAREARQAVEPCPERGRQGGRPVIVTETLPFAEL